MAGEVEAEARFAGFASPAGVLARAAHGPRRRFPPAPSAPYLHRASPADGPGGPLATRMPRTSVPDFRAFRARNGTPLNPAAWTCARGGCLHDRPVPDWDRSQAAGVLAERRLAQPQWGWNLFLSRLGPPPPSPPDIKFRPRRCSSNRPGPAPGGGQTGSGRVQRRAATYRCAPDPPPQPRSARGDRARPSRATLRGPSPQISQSPIGRCR